MIKVVMLSPCIEVSATPHSYHITSHSSQLTFTCSKSTIETQEKSVKYVQNNRTASDVMFLETSFSRASNFDFEQVNVS